MIALLKNLRHLVGGWRDYGRYPDQRNPWGGPFNGQAMRTALFVSLLERTTPIAIVETGTYRAVTTEYFSQTGLPVFTLESVFRAFGFAYRRVGHIQNIRMIRSDSRRGLVKLLDGPLRAQRDANLFFYLDAHWHDDLPLAEELEIIFTRCPAAVVMIDDFQVADDPGYAYDDYGPDKALTLEYILPAVWAHDLSVFLPSTPSAEETGFKRGCVVLAKGAIADAVATSTLVRPAVVPA